VQGAWPHGEVPSKKPRETEVKLTEPGWKFPGTGAAEAPGTPPKAIVPPANSAARAPLISIMLDITTAPSSAFRGNRGVLYLVLEGDKKMLRGPARGQPLVAPARRPLTR
jgi:hypothetical protein